MPNHHHSNNDDGPDILTMLWYAFAYFPFLTVAIVVGVIGNKVLNWHGLVCTIVGSLTGLASFHAVIALNNFAESLSSRSSRWALPPKLMVIAIVSGPAAYMGYVLGTHIVEGRSLIEKIIAGGALAALLGGAAYSTVIENSK